MRIGEVVHAAAALRQAVQLMLDENVSSVDLSTGLIAYPVDSRKCSPLSGDFIYVLPHAGLHVDPWYRITVWGCLYGEELPPDGVPLPQKFGRSARQVLIYLGAGDTFSYYAGCRLMESKVNPGAFGAVLDLLYANRRRVPNIRPGGPWWLASCCQRAWQLGGLGPQLREFFPPHQNDLEAGVDPSPSVTISGKGKGVVTDASFAPLD